MKHCNDLNAVDKIYSNEDEPEVQQITSNDIRKRFNNILEQKAMKQLHIRMENLL